jgi:hypothetical protein
MIQPDFSAPTSIASNTAAPFPASTHPCPKCKTPLTQTGLIEVREPPPSRGVIALPAFVCRDCTVELDDEGRLVEQPLAFAVRDDTLLYVDPDAARRRPQAL